MRALTSSEIEVVSGGQVDVTAPRLPVDFKPLWKFLQRYTAPLTFLWNTVDTRRKEISAREDWFALKENERTEPEIVDGYHVHHVVWEIKKDEQGNVIGKERTDRFYLDIDGNGKLDTQFRITSDGTVEIEFAPNKWREQPRSDWRNGATPPDPKQVVDGSGDFQQPGPNHWDNNPEPWLG